MRAARRAARRVAAAGCEVGGTVRLENLSRPILDLALHARISSARSTCAASSPWSAPAISQLRGPVFGATLTGSLLANSGVLYFADLVNKRIIDLEDPSIADLVDTTLIRRENLGAKFQNRFLDSLRIDDLRVEMGSDVWLRSAEANIQLEGRVRLSKTGADVQADRHAERAARHLHAQDRAR